MPIPGHLGLEVMAALAELPDERGLPSEVAATAELPWTSTIVALGRLGKIGYLEYELRWRSEPSYALTDLGRQALSEAARAAPTPSPDS
jgi:DNA-binding IclR family transcriptional regulator